MDTLFSDGIKNTPPSFVRGILKAASDPEIISFAGGLPNPISFPKEELLESMQRVVHEIGALAFQYASTPGLWELRQYICQRYNQKFHLDLTPDHILITTGSQQALDLIGKIFLNKNDGVIVEKPTYLAAIQAFSMHEPTFYSVELENDGLNLDQLKEALSNQVKFIYTIPDFQNPTGLTYSQEKREQIYELLKDKKIALIEDDPYGELRFEGEHLPYIGMNRLPYSIVLGSFSKIITPGMRIGYIITKNKELHQALSIAKEASDLHTNIFSQYVIYDYLMHNDIEKHIDKIKSLYKKQAQAMIAAMEKYFPQNVQYTKLQGGMFCWVTLPPNVSAMELFEKALEMKVAFVPGNPFFVDAKDANTLRLNFTNVDCDTIEEGIRRIGDLLKEM